MCGLAGGTGGGAGGFRRHRRAELGAAAFHVAAEGAGRQNVAENEKRTRSQAKKKDNRGNEIMHGADSFARRHGGA